MNQNQFFWLLFSFILTIMIFSYIVRDNPLFRIATYFFIGVSAAYVFVLIFYQIIIPKLILPFFSGDLSKILIQFIPLMLSILLIFKLNKQTSSIGDYPLAFLVGSGSVIILISAYSGTLIPMIDRITEPFSMSSLTISKIAGGLILVIGAISSLLFFQFSKKVDGENPSGFGKLLSISRKVGSVFIGITLGSIFAGVIISSILALIERLNFIVTFLYNLFIG